MSVVLLILLALQSFTLRDLDNAVAERNTCQQIRQQRIDSLRGTLSDTLNLYEQYEICGRLVESYRSYSIDSQSVYTQRRLHISRYIKEPFFRQAAHPKMRRYP